MTSSAHDRILGVVLFDGSQCIAKGDRSKCDTPKHFNVQTTPEVQATAIRVLVHMSNASCMRTCSHSTPDFSPLLRNHECRIGVSYPSPLLFARVPTLTGAREVLPSEIIGP